ncbi:MAG: hypothetical protein ACHREM_21440 [Polyangiales bacterium]
MRSAHAARGGELSGSGAFAFDDSQKGKKRRVGVDLALQDGTDIALLRGGAQRSRDVEYRRDLADEITRIVERMKLPAPRATSSIARE